MYQERYISIVDEIHEVETMDELNAIRNQWFADRHQDPTEYDAVIAQCVPLVDERAEELKMLPKEDPQLKLLKMLEELSKLRASVAQQTPVQKVARAFTGRKYKLLKTEVNWTTKPQVLGLMHIIGSHAKPGDVLDEQHIIEMVVKNEHVLNTRQGGEKIWNYYKGTHDEGLVAHGNFERL